MKPLSTNNFGLLIAFLLPGFTALWGASYFSETLRAWLGTVPPDAPSVGGFLYVTLASVAAGIMASTVRWAVIDKIHHWTGLREPLWDFSRLQENVSAYNVLREMHLRYYYFYGNVLVSLVFVYIARRSALGFFSAPLGWADLVFVLLAVILFAGSRDTLRKYYERVGQLLGTDTTKKGDMMCDGSGGSTGLHPWPGESSDQQLRDSMAPSLARLGANDVSERQNRL